MKKIPYSSCVLCTAFFVLFLFFLFLSTRSTRFAPSSWAQETGNWALEQCLKEK